MKRRQPRPNTPLPRRGGTTLTEVLMALLCMGIGVVAVASLFPIALLRSVQATQLTQGTVLRYNAETLIDVYDAIPGPGDTYPANAAKFRNLVLNPNYDGNFSEHFINPTVTGNPNVNPYLVDPLGWSIINSDGVGTPGYVGNLARYNFTITTEAAATSFVTLPDSWNTMYDATSNIAAPFANTATSITIPPSAGVDLADVTNIVGSGGSVRIVLFNQNFRMSEVRPLALASQISGNTISWTNPLPNNGLYYNGTNGNGQVTRIRIELQERRYTWLLTVRNFTPSSASDAAQAQASVDVVIFFNRAPSALEETVFGLSKTDAGGNPLPVRVYRVIGTNPFLKKGGYLLDTVNGTWHRLQSVDDMNQLITLEKNAANPLTKGVFMKGVIEVYHLGTKP